MTGWRAYPRRTMDLTSWVSAGTWLAAGLLILAGVSKLSTPDGAMATLHRLHLPSGRTAARALGLGEVAVGGSVLFIGGTLAAGVTGLAYLVLFMVAGWQRRGQVACGCFGSSDTATTRLHVATNVALAVVGGLGLAWPPASLPTVVDETGVLGLVTALALLAAGVGLLRTMLLRAAEAEVLPA